MRWIVFDYGEVISRRTTALPSIAEMLDVASGTFEDVYYAERPAYDAGCTDLEFWQAIGERLGVELDEARIAELVEADTVGWSDLDPDALQLIEDVHATGAGLALLSNAPSSFGRSVRRQDWSDPFRHLIFSGDLKLVKPDPEIYRVLLDVLGAGPAECVFFDDKQDNVEAARLVGLHAHQWHGVDAAREALLAHGVVL